MFHVGFLMLLVTMVVAYSLALRLVACDILQLHSHHWSTHHFVLVM